MFPELPKKIPTHEIDFLRGSLAYKDARNLAMTRVKDINKLDEFGQTILYSACGTGDPEIVKWVLEQKANVNGKTAERMIGAGWQTALHRTCDGRKGQWIAILKLLKQYGADHLIEDGHGLTADQYLPWQHREHFQKIMFGSEHPLVKKHKEPPSQNQIATNTPNQWVQIAGNVDSNERIVVKDNDIAMDSNAQTNDLKEKSKKEQKASDIKVFVLHSPYHFFDPSGAICHFPWHRRSVVRRR